MHHLLNQSSKRVNVLLRSHTLRTIDARFACKMSRSSIFDCLLLLLAPLVTLLLSKIQIFTPQSKYVVVHDPNPAPADLLISTQYLEVYANHNLAVGLLIGLSILSILHLTYFVYASWQPPLPVSVPWKTEFETCRNSKNMETLARSGTIWRGVMDVVQSQVPKHNVHCHSLIRSPTVDSNASQREDIELRNLTIPQRAHVRATESLRCERRPYELWRRAEEDAADWKTVYCEEWADSSDGEGGAGAESWSSP